MSKDRGRVVLEGEGVNWAGRINPACENTRDLSWCLWGVLGCKVDDLGKHGHLCPEDPRVLATAQFHPLQSLPFSSSRPRGATFSPCNREGSCWPQGLWTHCLRSLNTLS